MSNLKTLEVFPKEVRLDDTILIGGLIYKVVGVVATTKPIISLTLCPTFGLTPENQTSTLLVHTRVKIYITRDEPVQKIGMHTQPILDDAENMWLSNRSYPYASQDLRGKKLGPTPLD